MIGPRLWVKHEGEEKGERTTKKYRSSCRRRRRRRLRRFSFPRCELNSFRHLVKTCARLSHNLVLLPEEILFRWFPGYATNPPVLLSFYTRPISILCSRIQITYYFNTNYTITFFIYAIFK